MRRDLAVSVGAVLCAVVVAPPYAGAYEKGAQVEPVRSAAAAHSAPKSIIIRQNLAYGRQDTWAAGVKLTVRGAGLFGRGAQLRARLGGWRCQAGRISLRNSNLLVGLSGLGSESCDVRATMVSLVQVQGRKDRLITDFGAVRIGQRWSKVPRPLRKRVALNVPLDPAEGGGRILWVGRHQDPCNPKRPQRRTTGTVGPLFVGLDTRGRVSFIGVKPPLIEGVSCDRRRA